MNYDMSTLNEEIKNSLDVIRKGGIILYPTDTVWGLGCDATNAEAVKRVYEIKKRESSKALIVLVDSMARIQNYVETVPDVAWDLVEISEKPLSIIYSGARNFAPNLVADDGTIAIRVTSEAFSKGLCERMRVPLVSTSANISSEPTPHNYSEISEEILSAVDYVVDYRRDEKDKPSPSGIIKLGPHGEVQIIRE